MSVFAVIYFETNLTIISSHPRFYRRTLPECWTMMLKDRAVWILIPTSILLEIWKLQTIYNFLILFAREESCLTEHSCKTIFRVSDAFFCSEKNRRKQSKLLWRNPMLNPGNKAVREVTRSLIASLCVMSPELQHDSHSESKAKNMLMFWNICYSALGLVELKFWRSSQWSWCVIADMVGLVRTLRVWQRNYNTWLSCFIFWDANTSHSEKVGEWSYRLLCIIRWAAHRTVVKLSIFANFFSEVMVWWKVYISR